MTKIRLLSAIRRIVAVVYAVLLLATGVAAGVRGIQIRSAGGIAIAVGLLVWAAGLIWGRIFVYRATAAASLLVAIALPGLMFNVFAVGDYLAASRNPPDVESTALWLVPLELLMLGAVYFLDLRNGTPAPQCR
jgi:hypothetical protein